MPSRIKKLLETQQAVKIVFDTSPIAHIFTDGTQEELFSINVDEKEMVQMLNKEFKVYFSPLQSNHCRHVFNVRVK